MKKQPFKPGDKPYFAYHFCPYVGSQAVFRKPIQVEIIEWVQDHKNGGCIYKVKGAPDFTEVHSDYLRFLTPLEELL